MPDWINMMWNPTPGASRREWGKPFRKGLPDFTRFIIGFDPFAADHSDGRIMTLWSRCAEVHFYTRKVLIRTTHEQRLKAWFALWLDVDEKDFADFKGARGAAEVRKAHSCGRAELFARMLDTMGEPPPGCAFPLYDWMQGPLYWPDMLPAVSIELNGQAWKPERAAVAPASQAVH